MVRVRRRPPAALRAGETAFNACKREDYPFVTRVSAGIAVGAFMDFGRAVDNWRNPNLRARVPRVKRPDIHRRRPPF